MEESAPHVIVVAGDPSGDIHAANLIREMKRLNPGLRFSGLGGAQMAAAGVEVYQDLTKISAIGFFEFLKHFGEIQKAFTLILQKVDTIKPAAVILVDYAGFNLRLAKALKKRKQKIFYYISPQVWASREGRVQTIRRYVDKLFVLFKFEEEFYAKRNVHVEFVGHPLLDSVKPTCPAEDFLRSIGFDTHKITIALLPGSRSREVEQHLPLMIEAARLLQEDHPRLQFIILKAEHLDVVLFEPHLRGCHFSIKLVHHQTYDGINASQLCLVASGTATLEIAVLEKLMVVVYKTSSLTWAIARMLVKIPYIAMVNIMAGRKVVPELVQFDLTVEKIVAEVQEILKDELKITAMKAELKKIKATLGEPGASARAARKMLELIES